ncbi:hypothetical protein [Rhodococcus sp. NPDC049939]|uniref:hypothetical protein n=1 Tax=Rhodococcus sp. NPDC049939 TaxID=3155511 RepID=UPI0033F9AF33
MRFRKTTQRAATIAAALLVATTPAIALAPVANAAQPYQLGDEIQSEESLNTVEIVGNLIGRPGSVFEIKYTAGPDGIDGSQLTPPELTYKHIETTRVVHGEALDGSFDGFVEPNTSVTLMWGYDATEGFLDPATLTVFIGDEEYEWSGDIGTSLRDHTPDLEGLPFITPLSAVLTWGSSD